MSEDIVSKAREIRRRLHDLEVVPGKPRFRPTGAIEALTDSLNEFTKAEVVNNEPLMRKHAPNVVHNYTVAISSGELKESAGLFPKYERLRSQLLNCREDNEKTKKAYEELLAKRNQELESLKATHTTKIEKMQAKYEDLLEQFGVMKGKFEYAAQKYDESLSVIKGFKKEGK